MNPEIGLLANMMNAGRYAEAECAARDLLARHPHLGSLWKVYGVALLRQAKDALPALQRATELLPDDAETHYYTGSALQDLGHLAHAIARYDRALELRPNYLAALVKRADACSRFGRLAEAVAAYRRALELQPELAEVHNNLGNALLQLRQLDTAAASYRRALETQPHFAQANSNLGNALRALGLDPAWLAQARHSLRESRYRASEVLAEFGDWLRLGR